MNISILTVFPKLYDPFLQTSLVSRAQLKELAHIDVAGFFQYVQPKERIDAPTFGHGSGMLIKPEVIAKAIEAKEAQYGPAFKIFFSPQGQKLTQPLLKKLVAQIQRSGHVMLIPARYEGMDARVEDTYADALISLGDFVLMGGDVPAMALVEGILRLIPGVVGKEESVADESFSGPFVDYPVYTQPVEWHGQKVPEVIRSGNHAAMHEWREQQAIEKTVKKHFTWLRAQRLSAQEKNKVISHIPAHYVALMHADVLIGPERQPGVTSVTSIDVHDIARSSTTYGIQQFFVVTPLCDQQKIVGTLLDFWQKGVGVEYNRGRHEAVDRVRLKESLADVVKGNRGARRQKTNYRDDVGRHS
jgi:tRNA (guanine37-N1)-methyltransferase